MKPTLRKPFGVIALILGLTIYAAVVATLSTWIERLPALAQFPIYAAFGVLWILPLKPLLLWMETGRWRMPR